MSKSTFLANMALEEEKKLLARAGSVEALTVTLDRATRLDLTVDHCVVEVVPDGPAGELGIEKRSWSSQSNWPWKNSPRG
jgi:hypothetical protein